MRGRRRTSNGCFRRLRLQCHRRRGPRVGRGRALRVVLPRRAGPQRAGPMLGPLPVPLRRWDTRLPQRAEVRRAHLRAVARAAKVAVVARSRVARLGARAMSKRQSLVLWLGSHGCVQGSSRKRAERIRRRERTCAQHVAWPHFGAGHRSITTGAATHGVRRDSRVCGVCGAWAWYTPIAIRRHIARTKPDVACRREPPCGTAVEL